MDVTITYKKISDLWNIQSCTRKLGRVFREKMDMEGRITRTRWVGEQKWWGWLEQKVGRERQGEHCGNSTQSSFPKVRKWWKPLLCVILCYKMQGLFEVHWQTYYFKQAIPLLHYSFLFVLYFLLPSSSFSSPPPPTPTSFLPYF